MSFEGEIHVSSSATEKGPIFISNCLKGGGFVPLDGPICTAFTVIEIQLADAVCVVTLKDSVVSLDGPQNV